MKVYKNLIETVGNTPLVTLEKIKIKYHLKANIIVKIEYFNPGGSVKDRIAKEMIEEAEKRNIINKSTVIIEPTSGNTGIGLAIVSAVKGYRLILTMPESMSIERRKLIKAYGAKIVLTPKDEGMKGAVKMAEQLLEKYPNSFMPQQFKNLSNPSIHEKTTGKEILEDTDNNVDIFVAGVGTGGTITGVGKVLKHKNPKIKIVAVEPKESQVLSGGEAAPHKIQGIGAGFIPEVLKKEIIDEIIKVSNEEAFDITAKVAQKEGLLVGISSGAAIFAAIELAKRDENAGKNIVVLLPDTGTRYLSMDVFD
ncbi:cysteine synthase A [Clostridium rectalis]|uniref:cysteine synthase A n=1 Tax=Clostridium rectalis TaxID=2040295 RepID=UPI000F64079E|nr:cysteine synthase A [Clostridium rectalis]